MEGDRLPEECEEEKPVIYTSGRPIRKRKMGDEIKTRMCSFSQVYIFFKNNGISC